MVDFDGDARRLQAALDAGGAVLAPTDTVYGLLARPDQPEVVKRIFALKRRPAHMILQTLLPTATPPDAIGCKPPEAAEAILQRDDLRPKITFILPLDQATKPAWLSERDEVGVRIPADPRIQTLLALTGPLFATSANAHGRPPGRTVAAILADLDGAPDAVWDAGELGGDASTVVNFNATPPAVLRWGVANDLSEFGLGHGD